MGLPVTEYRSTDTDAPQLTYVTPWNVINILKKCLVEGYGSKLPLGWTLEGDDLSTYSATFRNSAVDGSGGYMRVYSSTGSNGIGVDIRVEVAPQASSPSQLVNSSGYRTFNLDGNYQGAPGWRVIGTSRSFWLIIENNYGGIDTYAITQASWGGLQVEFWVGDIDSTDPNDAYKMGILSGVDASYSSTSTVSIANGQYFYITLGAVDSSVGKFSYTLGNLHQSNYISGGVVDTAESIGVPHTLTPLIISKDRANPTDNTLEFPYSRGVIPGLVQSSFVGYASELRPFNHSIGGKQYQLLASQYHQNLWIDLEEWYV